MAVIPDGAMLGLRVVPDEYITRLPMMAIDKGRLFNVRKKFVEQVPAFRFRHVANFNGEAFVHIKALAPGLGVGAHDRVAVVGHFIFLLLRGFAAHRLATLAGFGIGGVTVHRF